MDGLLTAREVATRLRVSPRTVYLWIESGQLESVRLSERTTRIRSSEVERVLRERDRPRRPDLSSVLWDIDGSMIDETKHRRLLIRRILEAGRPDQVAWLLRRYSRKDISDVLNSDRGLSRRTASAWRVLLEVDDDIPA